MHLSASTRAALFPQYVTSMLETAWGALDLSTAHLARLEQHHDHLWARAGCLDRPPALGERWTRRRITFLHKLAQAPTESPRRLLVDRLPLRARMGLSHDETGGSHTTRARPGRTNNPWTFA